MADEKDGEDQLTALMNAFEFANGDIDKLTDAVMAYEHHEVNVMLIEAVSELREDRVRLQLARRACRLLRRATDHATPFEELAGELYAGLAEDEDEEDDLEAGDAELAYGVVRIIAGAHKGKFGCYDDDEGDYRIVYVEADPMGAEAYALIQPSAIVEATDEEDEAYRQKYMNHTLLERA